MHSRREHKRSPKINFLSASSKPQRGGAVVGRKKKKEIKKRSTSKKDNIQGRVGDLLRRVTLSTGEMIIPKEVVIYLEENMDKIRKETVDTVTKELGKRLVDLATKHTIRFSAEISFEPKAKDRKR